MRQKKLLSDKVILITGASKGIGRAVALECAVNGAHVIITSRTLSDLEKLDDENKKKLVKEVCSTIEKEDAGYDINAYKDAPAGIRIWGGATVESSDIDKLLPWIEWAFFETLERYK